MKYDESIKPTDPDHLYSEYMEKFYSESDDPWGNKGKYINWFSGIESQLDVGSRVQLVDIGCGGGHVLEGLVSNLSKLETDIKLTGVDISQSAIDYLNKDERFIDLLSEPFQCKSITDEDYKVPVSKDGRVTVYSMVDVLYYIRSYDWHQVARRIMDQVPVGSYVVVADSLRRPQYRYYYRDKYKPEEYGIEVVDYGKSETPVSEEVTESGRIFRRWLNWVVYRKVQ